MPKMRVKILPNRMRTMPNENQAALVEPLDAFVQGDDQAPTEATTETTNAESATVKDATNPETTEAETPKEDGFQKRINKVTADKYAEKRRADALQAKLDELSKTPSVEQVKAPVIDDFDDDDAFNQANIHHQVKQELAKQNAELRQTDSDDKARQAADDFNQKVTKFGKEDFFEKANSIPDLPAGVADALMQSESGAELIYHLGSHLDKADALAQMTPAAAMMELGRLSVEMSKKPEPKLSAAPDPIEPVTAGSALSDKMDDEMSIDAWMSKYN